MKLDQILALAAGDFSEVNQLINVQLKSNVPIVEEIGRYIVESGGKRLRPMIALLVSRACNPNMPASELERSIKLATIVEFIHTATLLHDDVVDESSLRRGRPTANDQWGNPHAVLVGDFLYSRAFQLMVELGSMPIMSILSQTTNMIAEGEVLQLVNCHNPETTEAAYFEVIASKTAILFEAAAQCAALLYQSSQRQQDALRAYGSHLGVAFQLIDDALDYSGSKEELGKNVGDDLAEGKPTLPLIYTMAHGTADQAALVRNAIETGGLEHLEAIVAAVQSSGALEYTQQRARQEASVAKHHIELLPQSNYSEALSSLADLAVQRTN